MDHVTLTDAISNIDNLFLRFPTAKNFYFSPGTYYITQQLNITTNGVRFIGVTDDPKDVHIIQQTTNANGLNITAFNITLKYISIHTDNGSGVCLTVANSNWIDVNNCTFYGSNSNFTIYFAGKTYASDQDLINGYNNNIMDSYNNFNDNIVYSNWNGDAVSFSLQRCGSVRNNIVRGGKISIYVSKDSIVSHNKIINSSSHGIYVSVPSDNLKITNNKVVNSTSACIKTAKQTEHPSLVSTTDNILIDNNHLYNSQYFGIEATNIISSNIINNKILTVANVAIYLLNDTNVTVNNNFCATYNMGILVDVNSTNNTITNNQLFSTYPNQAQYSIILETGSSNNTVTNNTLSGICTSSPLNDLGQNNTTTPNPIVEYISYFDELIL